MKSSNVFSFLEVLCVAMLIAMVCFGYQIFKIADDTKAMQAELDSIHTRIEVIKDKIN